MALSANTAWEIRPTNGSDTSGGGYVAGSGTTDYSTQNAPQLSVSDAACTGNTTVTSTTGGFTAAMVGNIMYLSSGPGWYQITARASSNSITIDRNGPNASGMTANVGGAMKTIPTAAAIWVAGNAIFVKAEATIVTTASIAISTPNNNNQGTSTPYNRIIGYTTTRTDGGKVTIQLSTNTGLKAFNYSAIFGHELMNFIIDCNNLGTSTGISGPTFGRISNVLVKNFTTAGIALPNNDVACINCEITAGTSAATAAFNVTGTPNLIANCNIHDNACPGISLGSAVSGMAIVSCLITNNTGAASDGIISNMTGGLFTLLGCVIYGSGRHGFNGASAFILDAGPLVRNNIFEANGGFGFKGASAAGFAASAFFDGNGYYNNTSGARSNADDAGSTIPINAVGTYTNTLDVINTTGSFFTNAAGGDFTLNNTANQGALVRGHGTPGTMPGVSQVGYRDMGVFQHQDAGGASGSNMRGGFVN